MQPCVYLQVEDTCIVEHCPDGDIAIEVAPLIAGMAESEDATEIECVLWNASIGGCKDVLPALHCSNDNEDEGGEEHEGDAHMSNDLSFSEVGSTRAAHESDSNFEDYSKQCNEGQPTQMVD